MADVIYISKDNMVSMGSWAASLFGELIKPLFDEKIKSKVFKFFNCGIGSSIYFDELTVEEYNITYNLIKDFIERDLLQIPEWNGLDTTWIITLWNNELNDKMRKSPSYKQ